MEALQNHMTRCRILTSAYKHHMISIQYPSHVYLKNHVLTVYGSSSNHEKNHVLTKAPIVTVA